MKFYIGVNIFYIVFLCSFVKSQLFQGDACELSSNKRLGQCISLTECPSAILELENGNYPQTCSYVGNLPIVCCPKTELQSQSLSERNCLRYASHRPEIQIFAIVGGTETLPREFPHMASLGYKDGNKIVWSCGGSLVSEKFILTAAHCLASSTFGKVIAVRLGDVNLQFSTLNKQDYKVIRRIAHPNYKMPSVYNDIALLELDRSVKFTSFVKPACLYTNPKIDSKIKVVTSGWGLTSFGGQPSNTLQKVTLELFTTKECNQTYENIIGSRRLKNGIIGNQQICAGSRTEEKDACQGDSGGPLEIYRRQDRIWSIVGVTSFGKSCAIVNVPGVYTRVSNYIPWLESIIWPKTT